MTELTAREILSKYFPSGISNDPEISEVNTKFVLKAFREIAELSWEASHKAMIDNTNKIGDTYFISGKIQEDKTEFLNRLFPNGELAENK